MYTCWEAGATIINKVWAINAQIRVLNYEGNPLDCACIAAMTALMHFKRPDVGLNGQDLKIVLAAKFSLTKTKRN